MLREKIPDQAAATRERGSGLVILPRSGTFTARGEGENFDGFPEGLNVTDLLNANWLQT